MLFNPSIFIVKNEYHITILTSEASQVYVKIGNRFYFEDNSGIIPTIENVHKIIVKQSVLDKAGKYSVYVRKIIEKSCYYPKIDKAKIYNYNFKNDKLTDLRAIYLADLHGRFKDAVKLVDNYKDIDFIISNGDQGESSSIEDVIEVNKFYSDITKGEIPILFVRGNHDTRGKYAELLPKYSGMDNNKGYFTFKFRDIGGIALDCGEDKIDKCIEYGGSKTKFGVNKFELYRKNEISFIKKAKMPKCNYLFSVCHISFMLNDSMNGVFDIDKKTYSLWSKYINEKNIDFMLCGHLHYFDYAKPSETEHIQPHNYPVITASAVINDKPYGTLIEFNNHIATFSYVSPDGEVVDKFEIKCKGNDLHLS